MNTSKDVNTPGGGAQTPYAGFAPDVLPHISSGPRTSRPAPSKGVGADVGVSTRSVQTAHWYALRTTYGRERKAFDFIVEHGGQAFLPTIFTEKVVKGKKRMVETSRLPNLFFAYGTEDEMKAFVYDNYNLPFLRFYYKHTHVGGQIKKTPLIVPDDQIRSLQIICGKETTDDVLIMGEEVNKFKVGELVRVTEGNFKGVKGVVGRFRGQQRVGVVVDGLLTATTAYVPTAFLEKV